MVKTFWFLLGWTILIYYHEQAHKVIYQLAKAKPKFIWIKPLAFDYIPTKKVKPLNSTLQLQAWVEIIGYLGQGFFIFLLCILLIVFT